MGSRRIRVVVATGTWAVAVALLSAVSVAAPSLPEELSGAPVLGGSAWLVGLAAVTVQAGVLVLVVGRPAVRLIAVAAVAPVGAYADLGPAVGCTSVAVMVAAFLLGQRGSSAARQAAFAGTVLLVAAGELLAQVRMGAGVTQGVVGSLLQGVATVALPALVGDVVGTRRESRAARAGERAALVEAALARERAAMARELHDIAAHHLTGIAVMSAAISKQIDLDPAAAKQNVDQVRAQSTAMLRDMRGLVGLLRPEADGHGGADGATPPHESLDGIATLVETAVRRGADVELRVLEPRGPDPRAGVGPLAQLSAYRTVQEALTNAGRHAPGRPCRVELDARSEDEVRITVANAVAPGAVPSPGGGFGLVGMKERADLTGCRLTWGLADGTWRVVLVVPA